MPYLYETPPKKEEDEEIEPVEGEPIPEEEELTDEELDEAQEQGEATQKAMSAPPQNKALAGASAKGGK